MKTALHPEDFSTRYVRCPRCGANGFEILSTHSYCIDCNYCPSVDENYELPLPEWALNTLKEDWKPENQAKTKTTNLKWSMR